MSQPLYVSFLWHMHQPYYRDPLAGEYFLPWVYLHAVKDYYDMAAIVDETPGARVVFNLVPSLLEQLVDYAAGTAVDPYLVHGRLHPDEMGDEDRLFLLEHFFAANRQHLIEPHRRYLELLYLAGDGHEGRRRERLRSFRTQELLDLQVWFFLAWTGPLARRHQPELEELVSKGKNFTTADKETLFAAHRRILQGIIPLYRKLHAEGKAELTASPYYHPILPLLCDTRSALGAMPRVALPQHRLQHPEDARAQVVRGLDFFEELLGCRPAGMWPSEGSVSEEVLELLMECGLRWAASDEGVLVRSLPGGLGPGREALYQPHLFRRGGRELGVFFRDHALSDLIGFTYSTWEPERAVADFVGRLQTIQSTTPGARVVPVILDGENAWEYYPDNGASFLRLLYERIAATPGLALAPCGEVLQQVPARELPLIHPGSWINADYGIWIGHPEENLAWDYLWRARAAAVAGSGAVAALLRDGGRGAGAEEATAREISASLYSAEGSDWFWWYGDDHFSPHSDRFDLLFRRHLMNVYRLLGQESPRELREPIKKKSIAGFVREPAALITPTVNGLVSDYFEWLGAGLYDLSKQASAMHAAESLLQSFYYGFDRASLYFRIDGVLSLDRTLGEGDALYLHLLLDHEYRLAMTLAGTEGSLEIKQEGRWHPTETTSRYRLLRIGEVEMPLAAFSLEPGAAIFAYLTLLRGEDEVGRWPVDTPMQLKYAGSELELDTWLI